MKLRRTIAAAGVAAMSAALAMPATGANAPRSQAVPTGSVVELTASALDPSATSPTTQRITLITGDLVSVSTTTDGQSLVSIEPAEGSSGGVQTQTIGKNLYVIPDAAQSLLAAGRLDRELFNVTKLIEYGYGNPQGGRLPMIATYSPRTRSAKTVPSGASKTADLPSINATAMTAKSAKVDDFWRAVTPGAAATPKALASDITKLWLDSKVQAALDESVAQIGAPEAWAAGYDGSGVTVGVLDGGIDATHPDLSDRVLATQSFVPDHDATDPGGHGTHVASTIAGSGAASDGKYKGVAPGAKLVAGRVLDENGYGQMSWIIAGMEWAAGRADVVNMSLGDPQLNDGTDPMAQALNRISAETGTLFVVAAGNSGFEGTIGSPGTADAALTVAAVDHDDVRAYFSSMGPRVGDNGLKPDIAAPGVDITAARSQTSPGEGMYVDNSGTSMASPHVAGAAAIVIAKHPEWSAQAVKDALVSSSRMLAGTNVFELGSGRLDVPDAIDDIRASEEVALGNYTWPHDGDEPVTRTITYTNSGGADLALTLDEAVEGPDRAAVDGLVTLSASTVTVPAHGTAEVAVTVDADDATQAGNYTGNVVATDASGAVVAHTSLGLAKEPERYDLNVSAIGRDGKPTAGSVVVYRYGDAWVSTIELDPTTGRAPTQRLAPGVYAITSWLKIPGDGGPDSSGIALLGNPHLVVGKNGSIVLDARKANKVTVTTPKVSEDRFRRLQFFHDSGIGGPYANFAGAYLPTAAEDDMYVAPTGPVGGGQYDFAVRWRRSVPLLDLAVGRRSITPIYQQGSARLSGHVNLPGVYAGTGAAEEYAGLDVKGKAVIVTRSDAVPSYLRNIAAEEAGAKLLVVVNDRPGKFVEYSGAGIPIVSLTKAEGDRLIALAKSAQLRITGTAVEFTPYLYDLTKSYPGEIPKNLSWAPRTRDLARVDHRFVGDPGGLAMENRYDCRSYQWPPCMMATFEPQGTGTTRTDYVSAETTNTWYQDVTDTAGWEQRHEQVSYEPGERIKLDYFEPITRPRLGASFWGPSRRGNFMAVNVPPAGNDDLTGSMFEPAGTVESRLYQDGQLVGDPQPYQAVQTMVPATEGAADYRFEQDTNQTPWRLSTRTESVWNFRSAFTAAETLLPLLQLDYEVETDLAGNARAGESATIRVRASHEPDVVGGGTVSGARLAISYDDGATWQSLRLTRSGKTWTAKVTYPRRGATFVSIRGEAWDTKGNRVEQEITRAYGLD